MHKAAHLRSAIPPVLRESVGWVSGKSEKCGVGKKRGEKGRVKINWSTHAAVHKHALAAAVHSLSGH